MHEIPKVQGMCWKITNPRTGETFSLVYKNPLPHNAICGVQWGKRNSDVAIFIADGFFGLDDTMQDAVLSHEAGHIKFKHRSGDKRNLEHEIKADRYAAEQVGIDAMVKTLKHLHQLESNDEYLLRADILSNVRRD